jgi:molybdopterin-containing oxidoreductase family iron-sulfur binding subunit
MQCQNAPCVSVCPVGANFYNQDGIVIIDKYRCIGCRMCMAACPYGARYFNWKAPSDNPREKHGFEVEHPVGVVEKCMFCYTDLESGELPACVKACAMKALFIGDKKQDFVTNGEETYKLSELLSNRQSFRLFEELGTEPRVIYLTGKSPSTLYQEHADFPLPP